MTTVGCRYVNNKGQKVEVIENISRTKRKIKFIKTGHIITIDPSTLRRGGFLDRSLPTVYGVGYVSEKSDCRESNPAYNLWARILSRCYSKKDKNFDEYGGNGVRVCDRWLHFDNFQEDIKFLAGYEDWLHSDALQDYSLNKDIKGNGLLYSPNDCIFTNRIERMTEATGKEVVSIDKNGTEMIFRTINEACRYLHLQNANVYKVLNGERKTHKGYSFKRGTIR